MERISRDTMLMNMAHDASERGTCSRLQVGVVFSRDARVIVTGYNGAPAGMPHCDHTRDKPFGVVIPSPAPEDYPDWKPDNVVMLPSGKLESGCTIAQHAERNAIAFAARHGVALNYSEMHVTHMPCRDCAMSVINAGVKRVVYEMPYRKTDGVELLRQAGILVVAFSDTIG